jgi:hypothetical protein
MARRVFFSFHFDDIWRVQQVLQSNKFFGFEEAGYFDHSERDDLEGKGEPAVRRSLLERLSRTSVTVILVGTHTHERDWVRWEIEESVKRRNGLLGVYIFHLEDRRGLSSLPPRFLVRGPLGGAIRHIFWRSSDPSEFKREVEAAGQRADAAKEAGQRRALGVLPPKIPASSLLSSLGFGPPSPPPLLRSLGLMNPPPAPAKTAYDAYLALFERSKLKR